MSFEIWGALAITIGTVYCLLKRYETRLVLFLAGLAMAFISLDPMSAFHAFDKSMTKSSLIIVICSAMGFAATINLTKCDLHLIALLTKPLNKLGLLLLPCCMIVTGIASIAISSLAGLCAAIGPTMVALMIRAGFRPAIAAAAVVGSTMAGFISPGTAHNVFVAKIAGMGVIEFIQYILPNLMVIICANIVLMVVICLIYGDYKKGGFGETAVDSTHSPELPAKPNFLWAIAPLLPVVLLFVMAVWFKEVKMSVATAMLFGVIYTVIVTRANPAEISKKFFEGMGRGYGQILGLIIAAGVFAAGLKSCGVIDLFIEYLKTSNEVAKLGAAIGPYLLGVMTGSGDAAAFTFNEAVTPHAAQFGLQIENLGFIAMISAALGRISSPIAAGVIVISGIAGVSTIDVVKRTIPVMLCSLAICYILS